MIKPILIFKILILVSKKKKKEKSGIVHLHVYFWTSPTLPCMPMTLLMTMMCPALRLFMSGMTSLIMRMVPKKLVSNTIFIWSRLMLSTGPSNPTPALFTAGRVRGDGLQCDWLTILGQGQCLHACALKLMCKGNTRFHWSLQGEASDVQSVAYTSHYRWDLLRMSMCLSWTLLMHCLTESSLHTSRACSVRVFPNASPAACTSLSFFFRSRMVAIT